MEVFKKTITDQDIFWHSVEQYDGVHCAEYLRSILPVEIYQIRLKKGERSFKYNGRIYRIETEKIHQQFGDQIRSSTEWIIRGWNGSNKLTRSSKQELIEAINKKFYDDIFRTSEYLACKEVSRS